MCKVVQYRFRCGHVVCICRSRCLATIRRFSKPACLSHPYVCITLGGNCSRCLHTSWQWDWDRKLSRARLFHYRLMETRQPGAQEVAVLLGQLQAEYDSAAWRQSKVMPIGQDKSIVVRRSNVLFEERKQGKASPLRQEVQSCDVAAVEKYEKGWMEGNYGEDYVPNTYASNSLDLWEHPLDAADDTWLRHHLHLEEEPKSDQVVEMDWDWGESGKFTGSADIWANADSTKTNTTTSLTAWASDDESTLASLTSSIDLRTKTDEQDTIIAQVIASFWQTLNSITDWGPQFQEQSQQQQLPSIQAVQLFNSGGGYLADAVANNTQTHNLPKLVPFYLTLPRRPSTLAIYERIRESVQETRHTNTAVYFSEWLRLSRMEIQDFVGFSQGRRIEDPKYVVRAIGSL